jgi:hypothetical protein
MSFLAPLWLGVAAIAALGVVVLHLITTQRPPPSVLPTARFVPAGDARASSRTARPTDLPLLLLRCAALVLAGAAFAGPLTHAGGSPLSRVIVVDRSRGTDSAVRDSAMALVRAGDALVLFDSSAMVLVKGAADALRSLAPDRARGSLSAALVGARRAARDAARGADSVELVIISPLTAEELDATTSTIFARWPGRVRLVRTAAARRVVAPVTLVSEDPDDPLRPAIAALNAGAGAGDAGATVRIVRAGPTAADSAAAKSGAALVYWPPMGRATPSAEGLWAGTATLVAPLARLPIPEEGRVLARWADGARAAAERTLGRGCVRSVGVGIPLAGDVTIQPAFVAVARFLLAPCDGTPTGVAVSDSLAHSFMRGGAAAPAAAFRSTDEPSSLAPWLLGAALLLLAGELFVRRVAVERPA